MNPENQGQFTCGHIFFSDDLNTTVLPAKSDSGVIFCLQNYQDLESIDHLCINPIGLIHK